MSDFLHMKYNLYKTQRNIFILKSCLKICVYCFLNTLNFWVHEDIFKRVDGKYVYFCDRMLLRVVTFERIAQQDF